MFFDDTYGGMAVEANFVGGSLDAMEHESAQRTQAVLQGVDDLLYAASDNESSDGNRGAAGDPAVLEDCADDFQRFDYDRHCGVGYSAHRDGVDAEEVL